MAKKQSLEKEIETVEKYEYLLVKYIKEISNQTTSLLLIIATLFMFVLLDVSPELDAYNFNMIKLVLVIVIIGGFAFFGLSGMLKKKIEDKFEKIFS